MSKALPPIQDHRPASVERGYSSRSTTRGAGYEEHQHLYTSSARVRSPSTGATADSRLNGLATLPRLPHVEFSLGPLQDRVIPPYNDLEDPHLVPYWARKEMLIHEHADQRRRQRRQQEIEEHRKAAARRRFLQRRQQERDELASRKGELTRQREEEERQAMVHSAPKNSRRVPRKPSSARKGGAAAGGRSHQQAAAAASHRYYEAASEVNAAEMGEGRAADHEYVTSSSSVVTSRSASSNSDAASSSAHSEEMACQNEVGSPEQVEEKADAVKKVASRSPSSRSSSSSSSSSPTSSSDCQSSQHDHASEMAWEQAKAEARAEAEADARACARQETQDSGADDASKDELSASHRQSSAATSPSSSKSSESSAAAAYILTRKENGEAEAHPEREAVQPLMAAGEDFKSEAYNDDEFEKSSACSDAAVDEAGTPTASPQQQLEHPEEKPAAADETSEASKQDPYEEDGFDGDEVSSPKKASRDASDAGVSPTRKLEDEDQLEAYPEDTQQNTAALATADDSRPAEQTEDEYSEDGFSEEDAPKAIGDAANDAYGVDKLEGELSSKKSSATSSVAPSPVAASKNGDTSKEEVEDELDEGLPRKAVDGERKREGSVMSSAIASSPVAPSAPSSPSSSMPNSDVDAGATSAAAPRKSSAPGMDAGALSSGDNDTYADDFDEEA
ncbi:hypothetical protein LSCM4_04540 [Leishmania orientalis]|uniref:Starmaker n=1 Tax=Leishmania orientalis TaxID=2249476 RepID=A0A836KLE2_9TRYP|nr:hypothetical protein LSCM4_04540 [Leishmania orientalis]